MYGIYDPSAASYPPVPYTEPYTNHTEIIVPVNIENEQKRDVEKLFSVLKTENLEKFRIQHELVDTKQLVLLEVEYLCQSIIQK